MVEIKRFIEKVWGKSKAPDFSFFETEDEDRSRVSESLLLETLEELGYPSNLNYVRWIREQVVDSSIPHYSEIEDAYFNKIEQRLSGISRMVKPELRLDINSGARIITALGLKRRIYGYEEGEDADPFEIVAYTPLTEILKINEEFGEGVNYVENMAEVAKDFMREGLIKWVWVSDNPHVNHYIYLTNKVDPILS